VVVTLRDKLRTPSGRLGSRVLLTLAVAAALGAWLGPDPNHHHFDLARAPDGGPPLPSARHWLGTDPLHRDVLARLASGARTSLTLAAAAGAISVVLGSVFGVTTAVARRFGARPIAFVLLRALDVVFAFPPLLLVTAVGALWGSASLASMIVVLGLTGWTGIARVVHAKAEVVLREDFVEAARTLGTRPLGIAWRHVGPNVAPVAISLGVANVGGMVLAEAVLSYLTVGLPPPDASWGRMLAEAEGFVVSRPLLVFAPACAILLTMLGFHHLGEAFSERGSTSRERGGTGSARLLGLDLALVAAVFAATLLLPPPGVRAPLETRVADATPGVGGTLRWATAFPIRSLDPALASDENSNLVGRMVFSRLVEQAPDGTLGGGLAESLSWVTPTRLSVTLRDGVVLHDGRVLEAADVKRSIERALAPDVASGRAAELAGIVGFEEFRGGAAKQLRGLTAEGRVVGFELTAPDSTFIAKLSLSNLVPVCEGVPPPGVAKVTDLCGAGPFKVASFDPDAGVVLERHDAYFEPGLPYLARLELSFNVRPQAARYRFERGELDLLREVTSSDASLFRADPRWADRVLAVERFRVSAIYLDTRRPPFDDLHLRRAVSFAVDPSVLSLIRPEVRELRTVVPAGVPGRPLDAAGRRFDRARALSEMEAAGYPFDPEAGVGGYPDTIDYVTVPNSLEQHAAEVYKEQLAAVGLRVRLQLLTFSAYLAHIRSPSRSPMGWAAWQADYADPTTFFDPNLVADDAAGSHNYSGFASAELRAAVTRASLEQELDRRTALFGEAERIVAEAAPWVPTIQPQNVEVVQPWVHGYAPDPLRLADFTRVYLSEDHR
jgi:ABC-type dipeptide/oligopeptide/nickel transport system permease subunit/ABC-type transport system substrate-binding protein